MSLLGKGREELLRRLQSGERSPELLALHAWLALSSGAEASALAQVATLIPQDSEDHKRVRLLEVRALARQGELQLAKDQLEVIRATGAPEADLLLAEAALGHPDRRNKWLAALDTLEKAREHERLDVYLNLAEAERTGGDLRRARGWFERAHELATTTQDQPRMAHTSALLGNFLLEIGLPSKAEAILLECVGLCAALRLDLLQVTQGMILCSLLLNNQKYDLAREVAEGVRRAAARRSNWLAYTDGCMVQALCAHQAGEPDVAVRILLAAASDLRKVGSASAFNLIKARLAEMRSELGGEVFDPMIQAALSPR